MKLADFSLVVNSYTMFADENAGRSVVTVAKQRKQRQTQAGPWPQVRARLRPLEPFETQAGSQPEDSRMVEFWKQEGDLPLPDTIGEYSALDTPSLLGDYIHVFGRDEAPPDRDVIDFFAAYGPLWERSWQSGLPSPLWAEELDERDRGRLSVPAQLALCEPVWLLKQRARELRRAYQLYLALRGKGLPALRALLGGGLEQGRRIADIRLLEGELIRDTEPDGSSSPTGMRRLRPVPEWECRLHANALLSEQLSRGEAGLRRYWDVLWPAVSEDTWMSLTRGRMLESLTAALFLQLAQLVEENAVLTQCQGCGRLFHPGRRDQVYCSVRCGDATRQRGYYEARKSRRQSPRSRGKGG